MPTPFNITKEDVASAKAGQPGWYLLHIKEMTSGPGSNDPQSTTYTFNMVIKDGPDKTVFGATVKHYLSEKTPPAFSIPFIEAVTAKKFPESGAAPDLEKFAGRDVKAHLTWDTKFKSWKADDFMPAVGKVEP